MTDIGLAQGNVKSRRQDQQRSTVAVEPIDGGVLLIAIDRAEAQNLIDPATFFRLGEAFHQFDHDDSLRVAVIYARGPNFTPGRRAWP